MNILVTGDQGYIGSVLTTMLMERSYNVKGYDTGFYRECKSDTVNDSYPRIMKDIRDASNEDLQDIDAIIHLAALSNDPLGELAPRLTEAINLQGTIRLAQLARQAGVKRFIYSSSQSMYGIARLDQELDEDKSEKNPVTVYARTKWDAECTLMKLSNDDFTVVCFRPSTVFGVSPRLRCDIVFNNLVASAYTTGKIEIKSDGTPWRPVVHIRDVASAYIAGLEAPKALVATQAFNVGIVDGNYTVRDLADAAQRGVKGSTLTFTGEHGSDARTYRISFEKILRQLKDYYKPEWDLDKGAQELVAFFKKINFTEKQFRGRSCNRLSQIDHLLKEKQIDSELYWTKTIQAAVS
jgi:nucleoside-diphosphate-sugar epimerase